MDNKNIFAENLNYYMRAYGKSRREVSEALGVSYYTFTDWVKGKKYPRMDKVERLANYFGILKSDLIEEKAESHKKMQQKNDTLSDIVYVLKDDAELMEMAKELASLTAEQRKAVKALLVAFSKVEK